MSDPSMIADLSDGGHQPHRRLKGCLPMLVVIAVVVVLAVVFLPKVWDRVTSMFDGPDDYQGPGHGSVTVTIDEGQSITSMGDELADLGVVASGGAFVDAASHNQKATLIQPGTYQLKKEMKASDVVAVLVDPDNMVQETVTVPEGMRTTDLVAMLVKRTDFTKAELQKALEHPMALGLPAYAHGNPEGYLFPATYTVTPSDSATSLLRSMVDKWREETDKLGLERRAKAVNLEPGQAMTVASILEYEASRSQDYPKVARAIYNRLKADMPLQSDATVSYANGVSGEVWTTSAQRSNPSAYNTYQHTGLPPGPIGNPGLETIRAALNPADGPWLYWVVVNLRTGETDFATTLKQHNQQVAKAHQYCQTSDAC